MKTELQQKIEQLEKELADLKQKVNQPEKPTAEQYLEEMLPQLTGKIKGDYITWYLDDQWIFQQDFENKRLWCYYYEVWEVFEDEYDLDYKRIQALHKKVVCKALNCEGFTPV